MNIVERLQAPIKSDANEEAGKQGTKRCFEKSNADHNLAFNVTFLRCAKYSQLIRLCDIVALTADTTLRITAPHEPARPLGTFPQRPGNGTIQVFMFYGHNITRVICFRSACAAFSLCGVLSCLMFDTHMAIPGST